MAKKDTGNDALTIEHLHPGITRIRLPLLGKRPGPMNVYLFSGRDNIALIDTGSFMAVRMLKKEVARLGYSFADITRVVLTHGHMDHQGGLRTIAGHCGPDLQVCAHREEVEAIQTGIDAPLTVYRRFLTLTGTPLPLRLAMLFMFFWTRLLTRACRVTRPLVNEDLIQLGDYEAVVVATPGHTRGSISLYLPEVKALFSGDHILGHITPNALPVMDKNASLPVRRSQEEYFNSLDIIEKLNPSIIYPGHGAKIRDFPKLCAFYRKSFGQRQTRLIDIVTKHPGLSVYEIARRLFPGLKGKAFVLDLYLAISEAYTHLQVLEARGRIEMDGNAKRTPFGISNHCLRARPAHAAQGIVE
jgi:glyoxylase-like metal-dependent hydrolase (beta-lactamase superfamily II)